MIQPWKLFKKEIEEEARLQEKHLCQTPPQQKHSVADVSETTLILWTSYMMS